MTNRPTRPFPYQGINTTQRPAKTINVPQSLPLPLPLSLYISTIAGVGGATGGYGGDGLAAIAANLNNPGSVCLDSAGNMYIADSTNNCIRKVDAAGIITTFAGTGATGSGGDGFAANLAQLSAPGGVCVDSAGNVYIADTNNHRVRKVDAITGIITKIAGTTIGSTGDGSAAIDAKLNRPTGVFVHSDGSVYIADEDNNRIRKVDSSGIITKIAGGGTGLDGGAAIAARLRFPHGVFVDSASNVYITDTYNRAIRKVNASTGIISTIAGIYNSIGYSGDGGAATLAKLHTPSGVFVHSDGTLYIADSGNHCIRKVDTGGVITTIAGNGTPGYSADGVLATNGGLYFPFGLYVDSAGNVYIADSYNHRIRKLYNA